MGMTVYVAKSLSPVQQVKVGTVSFESEQVEGALSQQGYDAAKKGLDALLRRHMKKTDQSV